MLQQTLHLSGQFHNISRYNLKMNGIHSIDEKI